MLLSNASRVSFGSSNKSLATSDAEPIPPCHEFCREKLDAEALEISCGVDSQTEEGVDALPLKKCS